jgi:hypothetical protein
MLITVVENSTIVRGILRKYRKWDNILKERYESESSVIDADLWHRDVFNTPHSSSIDFEVGKDGREGGMKGDPALAWSTWLIGSRVAKQECAGERTLDKRQIII